MLLLLYALKDHVIFCNLELFSQFTLFTSWQSPFLKCLLFTCVVHASVDSFALEEIRLFQLLQLYFEPFRLNHHNVTL